MQVFVEFVPHDCVGVGIAQLGRVCLRPCGKPITSCVLTLKSEVLFRSGWTVLLGAIAKAHYRCAIKDQDLANDEMRPGSACANVHLRRAKDNEGMGCAHLSTLCPTLLLGHPRMLHLGQVPQVLCKPLKHSGSSSNFGLEPFGKILSVQAR